MDAEPVEVVRRSRWLVVRAWVFSVAGIVPLLGLVFGLVGLTCGVRALMRRDYSTGLRVSAGAAAVLGLAWAAYWVWLWPQLATI